MSRSAELRFGAIPVAQLAESEFGAPHGSSWFQCLRKSEGVLLMNRQVVGRASRPPPGNAGETPTPLLHRLRSGAQGASMAGRILSPTGEEGRGEGARFLDRFAFDRGIRKLVRMRLKLRLAAL